MKYYLRVGNRCAIDLGFLDQGLRAQGVSILEKEGFGITAPVDLVTIARQQIGTPYRRGVEMRMAPELFDCASFIKWLYGQLGIWLPRNFLLWLDLGIAVDKTRLLAGDIIFMAGYKNYPAENIPEGLGHVGMATDPRTVIHAADGIGVIETRLDRLPEKYKFRCTRRLIPPNGSLLTVTIPTGREVETSDDLSWLVHQVVEKRTRIWRE